jgi:hypothetical protein
MSRQAQAGQAPGVVKIRLSGERADIEQAAGLLARAGAEVLDRSRPRPNRDDPGERVYLTVRLAARAGQGEQRAPVDGAGHERNS